MSKLKFYQTALSLICIDDCENMCDTFCSSIDLTPLHLVKNEESKLEYLHRNMNNESQNNNAGLSKVAGTYKNHHLLCDLHRLL